MKNNYFPSVKSSTVLNVCKSLESCNGKQLDFHTYCEIPHLTYISGKVYCSFLRIRLKNTSSSELLQKQFGSHGPTNRVLGIPNHIENCCLSNGKPSNHKEIPLHSN